MRHTAKIALATFVAALVAVALAAPALAVSPEANCLGEDRSNQGGFASGRDFAHAIVAQHEFDRLAGFPASFGHSIAIAASTDCLTKPFPPDVP